MTSKIDPARKLKLSNLNPKLQIKKTNRYLYKVPISLRIIEH